MLFNSLQFLIFFPIVLIVYFVLPHKVRYLWLLAASYYFYMCWNAKYALLILASTLITYFSGLLIEKVRKTPGKSAAASGEGPSAPGSPSDPSRAIRAAKWVVAGSVLLNLGILFYFKYFQFALNIFAELLGKIGISLHAPAFDIILPVGISFYTFQALSYTLDVYRGEIYAEKNFFRYALFVSFFPQLVAGPIERSKNLLKQLKKEHKFDFVKARDGFLLMIWGFFLKLVLADRIAIFVDTVYSDPESFPGWFLAVATMLFAIQIYCDFAGYSTIAMGAAEILGIDLMENFDAPYLSTSIGDFWRRWHISLTSWFKDYLYIPLGGSRKGKARKYLNKMIVFLVSGLWHGASLSYVIWGGLNGLYQVIGEMIKPVRDKCISALHLNRSSIGHKIACGVFTFCLVDFAFIFFRAGSLHEAGNLIHSIFHADNPWILLDGSLYQCGLNINSFWVMIFGILVLTFADIMKRRGVKVRAVIARQDYWCRYLVMIAAICVILVFGIWGSGFDVNGFIYFQF